MWTLFDAIVLSDIGSYMIHRCSRQQGDTVERCEVKGIHRPSLYIVKVGLYICYMWYVRNNPVDNLGKGHIEDVWTIMINEVA